MTGDLDMTLNKIIHLPAPTASNDPATKYYVDTKVATNYLDMNNFQIKNLKSPTDTQDAINKKYFDSELLKSHLVSSHIENAFKYLSDPDESSSARNIIVHGIADFNESPHKNKKAYDIDLVYTAGTQNYNSQIGINLYPLPIGKYTVVMEYYYPDNPPSKIITTATKITYSKVMHEKLTNYDKYTVQFNLSNKDSPPIYLFFTIRGSGTTSTNPEGYLVFYGVKGWVNEVPSQIYDKDLETGMFDYDGGKMQMNMDLDLNGFSLINATEDYFHLKGYYKSSVNTQNVLFGNNPSTKVPFGGYLIEVYVLISSAAAGNDYAFRLIIRGHEHHTSNADITSTSNSKFHRLMDFNKNHFLPSGRGFVATISHDSHAATPPKFTEAKFYFKFFRDDNFS